MSDVPIDPIGAARRLDTILGRADLPYTYTDVNGTRLTVTQGLIGLTVEGTGAIHFHLTADAAAFARAVLAAAGDTGHRVVSDEQWAGLHSAGAQFGARSMRERATRAASDAPGTPYTPTEAIRALPLLPDDSEVTHSGCSQERSETPSERPAVHVATPEGITPCGEGHHDVTTAALIAEVTCVGCLQALALEKGGQVIAMRDERDRLRTAWESARRRARQQRDALREAMISETDRARRARDRYRDERNTARDERDRALQAARFGITDVQEAWLSAPMSDAARMLSEIRERHAADDLGDESLTQAERDRLWLLDMVDHLRTKHAETHATSMRWAEQFTRAEAHLKRLTASAGRSVEPLAEKAARLEAEAARLPEEDMVEPGDEVPGLAELRALVERLALDQAGTTKAVTKLLATVEDRLGITDEEPPADGILPSVRELRRMHEEEKASTPEAPTRYRDRDGDLWEETSPGYLLLAVRRLPHVRMSRPYAVVADEFGPLTPVTT